MSGSCVLKIPRVYKLNNLTPQEHEAARPLSLVGVGLLPTGTGCVEQHIPLNRKRKEGKPPFRHKLGVQCYITIAIHNGENAEAERVNLPGHLQVFDNSDMIYRVAFTIGKNLLSDLGDHRIFAGQVGAAENSDIVEDVVVC